jgi:hypothetical protein
MTRVVAVFAVLLALLGVARADVIRESTRTTVRAPDELATHADRLARRADEMLARIEADLDGLPRAEHIEIRLVKHASDLASVAPDGRGAPPWAQGVAWPGTNVVAVAMRAPNGDLVDVDKTLSHELAHLALDRALGDAHVPRWLTEGFAYLYSADDSMGRYQTLAGALLRDALIPFDEIDRSFPAEDSEVSLAYAQSYDFVSYLTRRGRYQDGDEEAEKLGLVARDSFRHFLDRIASGSSLDEAAVDAYGRPLRSLEDEWTKDLKDRYLWLPGGIGLGLLWGLGGLLLFLAWRRRRRLSKLKLKQWEIEEALADSRTAAEQGRLN